MAVIRKKIWSEYFDQVESKRKKFELRLNDFEVEEGDTLILEEWDKAKKEFTGRSIERVVTRVNKFKLEDLYAFWPKKEIDEKGIQIISID